MIGSSRGRLQHVFTIHSFTVRYYPATDGFHYFSPWFIEHGGEVFAKVDCFLRLI